MILSLCALPHHSVLTALVNGLTIHAAVDLSDDANLVLRSRWPMGTPVRSAPELSWRSLATGSSLLCSAVINRVG